MAIGEELAKLGGEAIDIFEKIYGLIFPEFPAIGFVIAAIALLTVVSRLARKKPPLQALGAGAAIFLTLTILFCFLHFVIKLFVMLQDHKL